MKLHFLKALQFALGPVAIFVTLGSASMAYSATNKVSPIMCKQSFVNGDQSVTCVEPKFPFMGEYRFFARGSSASSLCKLMGYKGKGASYIVEDIDPSTLNEELVLEIYASKQIVPIRSERFIQSVTCR